MAGCCKLFDKLFFLRFAQDKAEIESGAFYPERKNYRGTLPRAKRRAYIWVQKNRVSYLQALMNEKVIRLLLEKQIKLLPILSEKCSSNKEFIKAALQNIVESIGLKRATYLTCILQEGRIDYDVTADTFPADRDYVTCRSSEVTLLLVNIILENANQRYMERTLTVDDEELNVKVFQIQPSESNSQHILVLTTPHQGSEDLLLSDDDKKAGFTYLKELVETAASIVIKT